VFLNVIIPSYRSRETIAGTIQPILDGRAKHDAQDPHPEFDITVVDSSDDGTSEYVRANFPDLKLIQLPERAYPGAARNRGVEATRGDVLCFIDSDAVPHENWLLSIEKLFSDRPGLAAAGGPVLNANPTEGYSRLAHWCEFSGYGRHAPQLQRRVLPTVNVAIRRTAFERYGPFIEDQFGNEDVLLFYRMFKAGEPILFVTDTDNEVYHRNKTSLEALYEHQRKLGESTGRARVKYDLPGSFLTRGGGSSLIPLIKTSLVGSRLLFQETAEFPLFLLHWPHVFRAMSFFAIGFREGVRNAREEVPSG
jgi:glycosyltransferase involved in cell wall biosynthesis